jgi:hypothetical protein
MVVTKNVHDVPAVPKGEGNGAACEQGVAMVRAEHSAHVLGETPCFADHGRPAEGTVVDVDQCAAGGQGVAVVGAERRRPVGDLRLGEAQRGRAAKRQLISGSAERRRPSHDQH